MTRQYAGARIHRTLTVRGNSFVAVCGRLCWGTDTDTAHWLSGLGLDGRAVVAGLHLAVPACPTCEEAA